MFIILNANIFDKRIDHIKYRNNVVTGVVAVDNGNNTYDCYISGADVAYPNIPTTFREPDFEVGEAVEILIEYGNKEMPIIIGHAKKVVQEFVEDKINVLVSTLDAYSITSTTTYFEGRVEDIEDYENVTRRGFYYGTSTGYGLDTYSTGSFAAGSYNEQATGLTANTTYHYQAYVHDAYNDVHTGDDKTMTTEELGAILISCDIGTGKIYIHVGIASDISSSFNAPQVGYYKTPSGLTIANGNLISCDNWGAKIHVHSGITSTITDGFDSPASQPTGLAFDGTNLISCDQGTDKIYIHDGISDVILDSFDAPVTGSYGVYGLTFDGTNLISCSNQTPTKIYIHDGVSETVLSSFSDPDGNPTGLAFDGTNLISAGNSANKIYIHEGVTSVISSNFNSPSTNPTGLTISR